MVIYFSGTGNSEFAAKAIAKKINDKKVIDAVQLMKTGKRYVFRNDDIAVIVFPVYVSNMAQAFGKFLRASKFEINKAYFVGTCASEMGATDAACREICKLKNMKYMGCARLVMPQNYIALFPMTKKEEQERRLEEADKSCDSIAYAILRDKPLSGKTTSTTELNLTKAVENLYFGTFTKIKKFNVADTCVGCGICEKKCPMNNIEVKGKPIWGRNCIHCMACINRCPVEAINYGHMTEKKDRYVCLDYNKWINSKKA